MRPVRFLYDYASPWSYLANTLLSAELPGITVTYEPVYLRGFEGFKSAIPYGPQKLAYQAKDLLRCAAHHDVPLSVPSVFPVNGLYALRAALVAQQDPRFPELHAALFDAAWRDDRDIGNAEVVADIASEVGFDRDTIAAGMRDETVKAELKRQTAAAAESGVFGVPTFIVDGELFWGHDRMGYVRRAAER